MTCDDGTIWPHEKVVNRSRGTSCSKSDMGSIVPPARMMARALDTIGSNASRGSSSRYLKRTPCILSTVTRTRPFFARLHSASKNASKACMATARCAGAAWVSSHTLSAYPPILRAIRVSLSQRSRRTRLIWSTDPPRRDIKSGSEKVWDSVSSTHSPCSARRST